ncbi:MAG: hypothetical protein P1U63_11255 [Coxiellaceae bacterium]|nr:hypothetical protein [Coxiellaceae bacterium]
MVKIKAGVTVVEVFIAIVLIAAIVVVLVQGKGVMSLGSIITDQQSRALLIARDQLAQLKKSSDGPITGSTVVNDKSTSYTVNWAEESYTNPDNKVLSVSVAWSSGKAIEQTVGLIDVIKLKKSVVRSDVVDEI